MHTASPRRHPSAPTVLILLFLAVAAPAAERSIAALGARAGDETPVTGLLQNAIDEASGAGGGVVTIPSGVFLSAPIRLRSHVTLRLERGAILRCIADPAVGKDAFAFVSAENIEDAGIEGDGTIDGNGRIFEQRDNAPNRPNLVCFRGSRRMSLRDVSLVNGGSWTCRLRGCDGVQLRGLRILSHQGYNNDGIDIDSRNVTISDCVIDCDDDAICFKSDDATPCENVTVTNCVAASNCNLIKFGTASLGGFRNITVSNCSLHAASEDHRRQWQRRMKGIALPTTGIAGIALEIVDGGTMDRVTLTNIAMNGVQTPVFIRLGGRRNAPGRLANVIISGITARTESLIPSAIVGLPGHPVEGVTLRDIRVEVLGRGTLEDARRPVPEKEKSYPENRMFGDSLPAYGLYVRHARDLTLDNVRFILREPDARPAVVFEDAHDVALRDVGAPPPSGEEPLLRIRSSSGISLSGLRTTRPLDRTIELTGCAPGALTILDHDSRNAGRLGDDRVPREAP